MKYQILISRNLIDVNSFAASRIKGELVTEQEVGTILSNMLHYGYAPSAEALRAIYGMTKGQLESFWKPHEEALRTITGDDCEMGDVVVYKKFPKEVLEMSRAQYWFQQVCIYLGLDKELLAQEPNQRPEMAERDAAAKSPVENCEIATQRIKVLAPAKPFALDNIYNSLIASTSRWNDQQHLEALYLLEQLHETHSELSLNSFPFKENGINLIYHALTTSELSDVKVEIKEATDVLRLIARYGDCDVSLRQAFNFDKIKRIPRSKRRMLLTLLENTKNIEEDMALRPSLWKKVLSYLHPGDFKLERVNAAYHNLYAGKLESFNSKIHRMIEEKDPSVVKHLATRPGEFARRLCKVCSFAGENAARSFIDIAGQLDVSTLVKLESFFSTITDRSQMMYPPQGNWSKVQVTEAAKKSLSPEIIKILIAGIRKVIAAKMDKALPEGVKLDERLKNVKLQTNDQKLASYGRGTVFDIPENMNFLRTASYWMNSECMDGDFWADNGINLFDADWEPVGVCCWNHERFQDAAVFSGDPVTSDNVEGRACQMIDLYIDKLIGCGCRYAVWNLLSWNCISFANFNTVVASLQWGQDAESGELFEPSRAQMVFPIQGKGLTHYVAYVDLVERKLVFMDVCFPSNVKSAASNGDTLKGLMPAYVEYLDSLPSVYGLFKSAKQGTIPVLYSDHDTKIEKDAKAYVFRPENKENSYTNIKIASLLEL